MKEAALRLEVDTRERAPVLELHVLIREEYMVSLCRPSDSPGLFTGVFGTRDGCRPRPQGEEVWEG